MLIAWWIWVRSPFMGTTWRRSSVTGTPHWLGYLKTPRMTTSGCCSTRTFDDILGLSRTYTTTTVWTISMRIGRTNTCTSLACVRCSAIGGIITVTLMFVPLLWGTCFARRQPREAIDPWMKTFLRTLRIMSMALTTRYLLKACRVLSLLVGNAGMGRSTGAIAVNVAEDTVVGNDTVENGTVVTVAIRLAVVSAVGDHLADPVHHGVDGAGEHRIPGDAGAPGRLARAAVPGGPAARRRRVRRGRRRPKLPRFGSLCRLRRKRRPYARTLLGGARRATSAIGPMTRPRPRPWLRLRRPSCVFCTSKCVALMVTIVGSSIRL